MSDFIREFFGHLCHQDPSRAWTEGGEALALCARCTGVYAGAALAVLTLPLARFKPSRAMLGLHGAAVAQMLFFGLDAVEQPAWLRTLSGSVFSAGAVYLMWLPVRARLWPRGAGGAGAYLSAAAGGVALLQAALRLDSRAAGAVVEFTALAGALLLPVLVLAGAVSLARRRRFRGEEEPLAPRSPPSRKRE